MRTRTTSKQINAEICLTDNLILYFLSCLFISFLSILLLHFVKRNKVKNLLGHAYLCSFSFRSLAQLFHMAQWFKMQHFAN